MSMVIPFKGIYYNNEKVSGGEVAAPPYDIITPELREKLYAKSPYNIVRVDFGRDDEPGDKGNKYERAARYLSEWLSDGVLLRSEKPVFFAYDMTYEVPDGGEAVTSGLFGLVRITELGEGVYPHEATHSKPKADRLSLMEACGANTSPIFSVYRSPEKKASGIIDRIRKDSPYLEARDHTGSLHRLWVIDKDDDIKSMTDDLSGRDIYIADGHHRYETALYYRDEMRKKFPDAGPDAPFEFVLMFLSNIEDGGITILPTHRLVDAEGDIIERMKECFTFEEIPTWENPAPRITPGTKTYGLYAGGKQYIIKYRECGAPAIDPALSSLDVTVLEEVALKQLLKAGKIAYEMDWGLCHRFVDGGHYNAAFHLAPTKVEDVERVAHSGHRMPPKSTYFYPKIMTGFVINTLE